MAVDEDPGMLNRQQRLHVRIAIRQQNVLGLCDATQPPRMNEDHNCHEPNAAVTLGNWWPTNKRH